MDFQQEPRAWKRKVTSAKSATCLSTSTDFFWGGGGGGGEEEEEIRKCVRKIVDRAPPVRWASYGLTVLFDKKLRSTVARHTHLSWPAVSHSCNFTRWLSTVLEIASRRKKGETRVSVSPVDFRHTTLDNDIRHSSKSHAHETKAEKKARKMSLTLGRWRKRHLWSDWRPG